MSASIAVITNGNYFARVILDRLFESYGQDIAGVLVVSGDYRGKRGLRSLWFVGRKTALPYLVYKATTTVGFAIAARLRPNAVLSVGDLARVRGVPVTTVESVRSPEAQAWAARLRPDLLVSVSCPQKISRSLLASARLGGVNIHSSLLPAYAGLAPYFWVLSEGERTTGTTVHRMTDRFDAGDVLVQREVSIAPGESAFGLFTRLALAGQGALAEAVVLALENRPGSPQDMSRYGYYSNPSLDAYWRLRRNGHVLLRLREIRAALLGNPPQTGEVAGSRGPGGHPDVRS